MAPWVIWLAVSAILLKVILLLIKFNIDQIVKGNSRKYNHYYRGEIATNTTCFSVLQTKPVDATIEGGAQKQQMINMECVDDFTDVPELLLTFM